MDNLLFGNLSHEFHILLYTYDSNTYILFLNLILESLANHFPIHDWPDRLEIVCLNILILQSIQTSKGMTPEDNTHAPRHRHQARPFHPSQDLDSTINQNSVHDNTGVVTMANSPSFLTSQPQPLPWMPASAPLKVVWKLSTDPYFDARASLKAPEGSSKDFTGTRFSQKS